MSDNIKLVIEIPKNYLETIKHTVRSTAENGNTPLVFEIIANGIPLDDVKAEMEKHQFSREYCCDHNIDTAIDMGMVRIILDRIGKAESEDK